MCTSTPTPTGAHVIPFPVRCYPSAPDPRYARLGQLAHDHFKAQDRDDKLAAIRAAFAEATPAISTAEQEILQLLRQIARNLESQLKGA